MQYNNIVLFRQWNVDSLVEASQEGRVDVPGTVGGTHQEDLLVTLVYLCQQLCFHPAGSKDGHNNLPQSSHLFSSTVLHYRSVQQYSTTLQICSAAQYYTTLHYTTCYIKCSFLLYLMKCARHWNILACSVPWLLLARPTGPSANAMDVTTVHCTSFTSCYGYHHCPLHILYRTS
jgi:hypothetical protein